MHASVCLYVCSVNFKNKSVSRYRVSIQFLTVLQIVLQSDLIISRVTDGSQYCEQRVK